VATSLIYRSSSLYELAMLLLYGRHYTSRYQAIADLIPSGSTVVDLCCGPALLYHRYLQKKSVRYTGLDVNARFIAKLTRNGGEGQVWDLRTDQPLPKADHVIMQASLYHFLPEPGPIVDRMLEAAQKQIVIAEPIRNLTNSDSRVLSFLGRAFTSPGVGQHSERFTEETLDSFFAAYRSMVSFSTKIAGGREKLYVLER